MTESKWTRDNIPDQSGKTFIVTGGNSGLGFQTAKELARNGALVVIACRNLEKARAAVQKLEKELPGARIVEMELDLASLESTRLFSENFKSSHSELHGLCNNAGVMALPARRTADGFEMQFGTNHLGHFALTAQLLELIVATPNSRIVTLSSTAHVPGRMRWDDLQWQTGYSKWLAYSQSKLANLLFALELARRLDASGGSTRSIACHPGYAATNLQRTGPRMAGSGIEERIMAIGTALFAQSAQMGALPILYAAASDDANNGDYFGPKFLGVWGHPTKATPSRSARNSADAERLWKISESLTGVELRVGQ